MKVNGIPTRTIWIDADDANLVRIIDQRHLPHRYVIEAIPDTRSMATAIRDMHVRGAGLITERGICPATRAGIAALFPEHCSGPDNPGQDGHGDHGGKDKA